MSAGRDAIVVFLATLTGAWAILSQFHVSVLVYFFVAVALVGRLLRWEAESIFRTRPDRAIWVLQLYVLTPFAVVALTTALIGWVGLNVGAWLGNLPDWIIDHARLTTSDGKASEAAKTASALVAGAITSLVAFLWSDASADTKSKFWPAGVARMRFAEDFSELLVGMPEETDADIAAKSQLSDTIRNDSVTPAVRGWTYPALKGRLGLIRKHLPDALPLPRRT